LQFAVNFQKIIGKKVVIGGKEISREEFYFENKQYGFVFRVEICCKKVGTDDGKYIVFYLGALFDFYNELK